MSQRLHLKGLWTFLAVAALVVVPVSNGQTRTASAQTIDIRTVLFKGLPIQEFLSAGGMAALFGPDTAPAQTSQAGAHDNGRHSNTFVNDPCLDPAPPDTSRTVQSETALAVLNSPGSLGKQIVAGYNDSSGFYDNRRGLSGFAYSTDGGVTWIDGGGLPPRLPGGNTEYWGDPVVVAHHQTQRFFYASVYQRPSDSVFTLSVNRGTFQVAPPQGAESIANTRCLNDPTQTGIPDPPPQGSQRIIWEPAVEAVRPTALQSQDVLDKPWLYVDQTTGTLYLTYTRFAVDGTTPLELARCRGCAFQATFSSAAWDGPFTIVPNELDTLNQATMPTTTPTGRLVVTWFARVFDLGVPGSPVTAQRIDEAFSDDDGVHWTSTIKVADVNPQREPAGYNRGRSQILNAPYIAVNKGADDGVITSGEKAQPGFGNIYMTYFSGQTPASAGPPFARAADIFVSTSTDNGVSWPRRVKVNDDAGATSHVFPTVQVNKLGSVDVGWLDRRNDPFNVLTDAWADVSQDNGRTFGVDTQQTDIATSWFVRADAAPNFGDYQSSALLNFNTFVLVWADGRFRPPGGAAATPDTIFMIAR